MIPPLLSFVVVLLRRNRRSPYLELHDHCHNTLLINNEVNMEEQDYTHTIWIECVDQYQADLVLKVLKENLTPDYYESLRKGIHFNDN